MNCFEESIAWQKAKDFAIIIYATFKDSRDWGFKDQIQRASISISNNIAEGFERRSNNEFRQFLYIAKGSCGEVRSMLYIAKDIGYINEKQFSDFHNTCIEISKMLAGLIKSLK